MSKMVNGIDVECPHIGKAFSVDNGECYKCALRGKTKLYNLKVSSALMANCVGCDGNGNISRSAEPDQSIKQDADKPDLTLVPMEIVREIARVRSFGVKKYGDSESWKRVEPRRYLAAAARHIADAIDNGIDSVADDSGIMHLSHAATNIALILQILKERQSHDLDADDSGQIARAE